jgi:hypothetical protein
MRLQHGKPSGKEEIDSCQYDRLATAVARAAQAAAEKTEEVRGMQKQGSLLTICCPVLCDSPLIK